MELTMPVNIHEAAEEIAKRAIDDIEIEGYTLREWIEVFKGFGGLSPEKRRQHINNQIEELEKEEAQIRADYHDVILLIDRKRDLLQYLYDRTYSGGDPHDSGQ